MNRRNNANNRQRRNFYQNKKFSQPNHNKEYNRYLEIWDIRENEQNDVASESLARHQRISEVLEQNLIRQSTQQQVVVTQVNQNEKLNIQSMDYESMRNVENLASKILEYNHTINNLKCQIDHLKNYNEEVRKNYFLSNSQYHQRWTSTPPSSSPELAAIIPQNNEMGYGKPLQV